MDTMASPDVDYSAIDEILDEEILWVVWYLKNEPKWKQMNPSEPK
jgi:hypothetical protein